MRRSLRRYWLWRVAVRFARRKFSVAAAVFLALLGLVAASADLLASAHPIAVHVDGATTWFPAWSDSARWNRLTNEAAAELVAQKGGWVLVPPVPYGPNQAKTRQGVRPLDRPGAGHLLGTDAAGRDVLARLIHGTRTALLVGTGSVVLCVLVGMLLGAAAAFFGGAVDKLIGLFIDAVGSFPPLLLVLAVQGLMGMSSLWQLVLAIGATGWADVARVIRGEVLRIAKEPYVDAARAVGVSEARILMRHILPGTLGAVMVSATFGIAGSILIESTLSFLGFGAPPAVSSWGALLADGFVTWNNPALVVLPGIALTATGLAINLVGQTLGEAVHDR